MSNFYAPGPGDLLPPFSGHPHDPRAPEQDSDDSTAEAINELRYWLNRAHIAALNSNLINAREYLEEAKSALDELLDPAA